MASSRIGGSIASALIPAAGTALGSLSSVALSSDRLLEVYPNYDI